MDIYPQSVNHSKEFVNIDGDHTNKIEEHVGDSQSETPQIWSAEAILLLFEQFLITVVSKVYENSC